MNIKQKLTTAAVLGSLAVSVMAPAASFAAENNLKIKNNGRNSDNQIKVENKKKTKVEQSNTSIVTNIVGTFSNTGKNDIKDNSGKGDATITTGNVVNNINVTVEGNTNTADVPCLCEEDDNLNGLVIKGNSRNSDNKIKVKNKKSVKVSQSTVSIVTNGVFTASNTGDNDIEDNTGKGDKTVDTGNVTNNVDVLVEGSTNTL